MSNTFLNGMKSANNNFSFFSLFPLGQEEFNFW